MSTGKDYGLPPEYADWVEVFVPPTEPGCEYVETGSRHHRVASVAFLNTTQVGRQRYFVPPKPKPTLPDVGPGAVVRYTDHDGDPVRVMRLELGNRDTWADMNQNRYTNTALLADVNDDGFTVELPGL